MHRFATTIIATIFVASASVYVYGDLVLDSQISAFNATVVDDRGHSVRVRGKILNVQVLYMFPSAQSPTPDNYDIDWKIKAQSSDGDDVGVYDFSLSDDSDDSDSSQMMDDLLQEMSTMIPVLMPVDSSKNFSPPLSQTSTRTGATTTAKSGVISPALTNLRSGNNSFDKSSPNAARSGSARVKRNADCEQSPTFEKPKVNEIPPNNQSSFQATTTKAASAAGNVSNVSSSNIANTNNNTLNSATNVTTSTMSNMPIVNNNNNNTGTTKSNTTTTTTAKTTKNQTHTGSGNGNTMIPSWMVILVPLFVITATRIE